MTDEESLIKQQTEYYRERAAEYDEWFLRVGRYDRGEEHRRQWFAEADVVRDALAASHPAGNILELACGTGLWTQHLAPRAAKLVAVDVSPEMIEINNRRVANDRITYIAADLFTWKPTERFDYIFFAFWLSHVPASRFNGFWDMVGDALTTDGKVFLLDSLFTQESTAKNHAPIDRNGRAKRKLNDGREFEIIKEYREPAELERRLRKRGWVGYIQSTREFFLYGCVSRQ